MLVVVKHSSHVDEHQDAEGYLGQGSQDNANNVDEEGSFRTVSCLAVEPSSMEYFYLYGSGCWEECGCDR